ncbi:MAG TPA: tail fiber domain-containing protein [Armatimonadota bacterium]|jgi:hypothetical protein
MKHPPFLVVLSLTLSMAIEPPAGAIPTSIPIQAVVQNAAGVPVNGTRSVTFLLYEGQNDIAPFWSETQTLDIQKGQLTTMLGKVTPMALPLTGSAFLGIRIGTDPEMTPRLPMGAAPFALALPNVFTTAQGDIGIGNIHPIYALDIRDEQAVTRLTSTNTMQGSIIELRNESDNIQETVGAINFVNHFGTYAGQVAYVEDMANATLNFKVAGAERMTVGPNRMNLTAVHPNGFSIEMENDGPPPITRIGSLGFWQKGTKHGEIAYPLAGKVNDGMAFTAGTTERARLTQAGLLGLGTADPQYALDVVSPGQGVVRLQSQNAGYGSTLELRNNTPTQSMVGAVNFVSKDGSYAGQIGYSTSNAMSLRTNSTDRVWIDSEGRVGIGLAVPAYPLDVQGDINARGSVRANGVSLTSDATYKANVREIPDGLKTVLGLRGVLFEWNRAAFPSQGFPEGTKVGLIAQEVERVLPQVVQTDETGHRSVEYQNIIPVLVEAIKSQQREIGDRDARIRALEDRMARLERTVAER